MGDATHLFSRTAYDDHPERPAAFGSDSLHEQRNQLLVVVGELEHRIRNLLSITQALAQQTARDCRTVDDFVTAFESRLATLARVQNFVTQIGAPEGMDLDELIASELLAVGVDQDVASLERVQLRGPAGVRLRRGATQILALALHELATNAAKHGALRGPGVLSIGWQVLGDAPDQRLRIVWRESSGPTGRAASSGTGYGRLLLERALPYQFGARTDYVLDPDGVRCMIELPARHAFDFRGAGS